MAIAAEVSIGSGAFEPVGLAGAARLAHGGVREPHVVSQATHGEVVQAGGDVIVQPVALDTGDRVRGEREGSLRHSSLRGSWRAPGRPGRSSSPANGPLPRNGRRSPAL